MKSLRLRVLRILFLLALVPLTLTPIYFFIPPISTLMLYDMVTLRLPERDWIGLKHLSATTMSAVLVAEDSAFCAHHGFDFRQLSKSINRAMDDDQPLRATSTISQQTAKNLFLWHGRSWLRKLLEAPLTFYMEIVLPKKRILEIYLNIAEWGDGIYGIEAAAQHYFGVSAKALNSYQAALLAAALPNPRARNATRPSGFYLSHAVNIQKRLGKNAPDMSCLD